MHALVRWLDAHEVAALGDFVAARNVPGGQLCLHISERPEEVAADLAVPGAPLPARCVVLDGPDGWRGAIAWEIGGPAGDRAWLFGPWTEPADEVLARRLLRAALERLPAGVRRISNFVDAAFGAGVAAHRALGFTTARAVHIMRAERAVAVPPPAGVSIARHRPEAGLDGDSMARLTALHDAAFPDTHTAMADIVGRDPARDGLWLARHGGRVMGYVCARRPPELPQGSVEYVAVAPDARGRGVGRALLSSAVAWLFGIGVPEVFLTVDAGNERALGVYRAAGFARIRTGLALDLRPAAADRAAD